MLATVQLTEAQIVLAEKCCLDTNTAIANRDQPPTGKLDRCLLRSQVADASPGKHAPNGLRNNALAKLAHRTA